MPEEGNEKTAAMIKRAEKDFAMDLPLLVEQTAQNTKILDAIIALEAGNSQNRYSGGNEVDNNRHASPRTRIHQQNGPISGGIMVDRLTPLNQRKSRKLSLLQSRR